MRRLGLLLTFPALLLWQSSVEFTGRYWMPEMASRIRVDAAGLGADIDARRDLGMPDTNFPSGDVLWQHGRNRVRFSYTPIDYTGDPTVTRTILFRGQSYTVGTRVVSEIEAQHLQLSWSNQFIRAHEGAFRLGPMVEVDGFLLRGSLQALGVKVYPWRHLVVTAGYRTFNLHVESSPDFVRLRLRGPVVGAGFRF